MPHQLSKYLSFHCSHKAQEATPLLYAVDKYVAVANTVTDPDGSEEPTTEEPTTAPAADTTYVVAGTENLTGVTVSEVRVSPDLSLAKTYVSIFPSAKAEEVMKLLNDNVKALRGELGHQVAKQLRIVPEIVFYLDTSLDYAEHIDELLKK